MNIVQPIRDKEKIADIASYLKDWRETYYIMFMIGIFTALRISDVLKLKVKHVTADGYITIREQKTNKNKRIEINPKLAQILKAYVHGKGKEEYLIKSGKGYNCHISRQQAWAVLKKAGKAHGLSSIGTHTLRKTFGYHHYKRFKDIAILQQLLNHHSEQETLRYIGITQDAMDKEYKKIDYGF